MKKFSFLLLMLFLFNCSGKEGPAPSITSIVPNTGYYLNDVLVTITGTNFAPMMISTDESINTPALPRVTVGGTAVTVTSVTATQIQAVIPSGIAVGTHDVVVTNPNEKSATLNGAYTAVENWLELSQIIPAFGCSCEKTPVTIEANVAAGGGFKPVPKVYITVAGADVELTRLAYLSNSTITAAVPEGLAIGGPYDVKVVNPDGTIGLLPGAFTVTELPPPIVDNISPASGSADTVIMITGLNFRDGAALKFVDINGNEVDGINVTFDSETQLTGTIPIGTSNMTAGNYLLKVINTDGTFGIYASFSVTNPAGNLKAWQQAADKSGNNMLLNTPREKIAAVATKDDYRNRFIYAIGGTTDAGATALNTIEVTQIDPFGRLYSWKEIPNKLITARFGHCAVFHNDYLYVYGGNSGGTYLNSVERAVLLKNADAPIIDSISAGTGGTLAEGTWYYKVTAVLKTGISHPNEGGETLASDMESVTVGGNGSVSLSWSIANEANEANVATYNVYRSDEPNTIPGNEHLIKSGLTIKSFNDTGEPVGTENYPPPGSFGVFKDTDLSSTALPVLNAAREGAGCTLAQEPNKDYYIYAVSGNNGIDLTDVEYAKINIDGSINTWIPIAATNITAFYPAVGVASKTSVPAQIAETDESQYLYVFNGKKGATYQKQSFFSKIGIDGIILDTWNQDSNPKASSMASGALIVNSAVIIIGGDNGSFLDSVSSAVFDLDPAGDVGSLGNFNAAGNGGKLLLGARAYFGTVFTNGLIYIIGGSDGTNALDTIEVTNQ